MPATSGLLQGKTLVLKLEANAGFFSCFNGVMNHLVLSVGFQDIVAVRADWHWDPSFPHSPFAPDRGQNMWEDFFEPLPFPATTEEVVAAYRFRDLSLTTIAAYRLYKSGTAWRHQYHEAFRKYIRLRPHILERAERFYQERLAGCFCLAVHYRNPRHDSELPDASPSIEAHIARARRLLPKSGESRVFLATDVEEAVDKFKSAFGDRLVCQTDVVRAPSSGHGEIHLCPAGRQWSLGEEVLIDCLLMSRCQVLLHLTSNIVTAAGFLNPHLRMVYFEPGWKRFVRSIDWQWWWKRTVRRGGGFLARRLGVRKPD